MCAFVYEGVALERTCIYVHVCICERDGVFACVGVSYELCDRLR